MNGGSSVLYIIPSLSYRGGERYGIACASGVVKSGGSTAILAGRVEKGHVRMPDGVHLYRFPRIINHLIQNNLLYFFLTFPIIFTLLLTYSKGYAILESASGPSLWASVIVAKIFAKKVVWVLHFSDIWKSNSVLAAIDNFFARYVDAAKTVVPGDVEVIKRVYGIKKVMGSYPPLPLDRLKTSNTYKKKKQSLLVPSVLHPRKNLELVIACMPTILQEFPDTSLIFVGEGRDRQRLTKFALDLGVGNCVHFVGAVGYDRLLEYYHKSELVLVPYYKGEGLTVVPFEALAAGSMCVIASGSAASSTVAKAGIGIVANPTVPEFSKAIAAYLRTPAKFEKLKVRGIQWVMKNMNLPAFWKQ